MEINGNDNLRRDEGGSTPDLSSGRLTYTRFCLDDAQAMFDGWANSEAVARWMFIEPGETMEQCWEHLAEIIRKYDDGTQNHRWAIRKDGACIGTVALFVEEKHRSGQLAYLLRESQWGHGYMTEAVRAVIRFGFQELGLNRIHADHFIENSASGEVMQKAGMHREGVAREKYYKFGTFHDAVCYSILRSDRPKETAAGTDCPMP